LLASPVGRAEGRSSVGLAPFCGGLVIGACLTGLAGYVASGVLVFLPDLGRAILAISIAIATTLKQLGLMSFPLPETSRQVPTDVFRHGPRLGALVFGFEMGTGVRTYLPAYGPHAILTGLVLLGASIGGFLAAAIGFGIGRAAMPLLRYVSETSDRSWDRRLAYHLRWMVPWATGCVSGWILILAVDFAIG
jgi:hypothetical protein